jgi:endoglycosylceramidase
LLGYDVFNEPNAGTVWASCASPAGCPAFDATLSAWYREVIPKLRAADHRHIIWIEPNVFFDFAAKTNLKDPQGTDRNTGFDFHTYCLGDGAAAAAPSIPGNGPGCAVEEQMNLANAAAYQKQNGVALLNSEWGATNDTQVVGRQTAEFDDAMLGDVFWDYNNIVPDVRAQPGGHNEDAALLAALDRPYPPVIAGTPVSWHWDSSTSTFTLRYSTTLPDGHAAGGLDTQIYLPRQDYPSGYEVKLTGATIVSSRATRLQLRNTPGAQSVEVTVTRHP